MSIYFSNKDFNANKILLKQLIRNIYILNDIRTHYAKKTLQALGLGCNLNDDLAQMSSLTIRTPKASSNMRNLLFQTKHINTNQ
jgi:hypothetical protein